MTEATAAPTVERRGTIPRSRVTIYDVAEKAGVSSATVSRIFSGYIVYAPETKRRVMDVARELGYVPNAMAKVVAANRSRVRVG